MRASLAWVVALSLVAVPAFLAAPAAATHACVEDVPCTPHLDPVDPEPVVCYVKLVRVLVGGFFGCPP